jgi:hypothetical protein
MLDARHFEANVVQRTPDEVRVEDVVVDRAVRQDVARAGLELHPRACTGVAL